MTFALARPASQFLAVSPNTDWEHDDKVAFFKSHQPVPFPDLVHLRIHRPAPDLKSARELTVDLGAVLTAGDVSDDLPLQWGDVVEIPEADHPLNEAWAGFSDPELTNLLKCLTRQVTIIVQGQTNLITLAPGITIPSPERPFILVRPKVSFGLGPVLLQSKLMLTSSDLSRVQVTRRDPKTGKSSEYVLDCSGLSQNHFNPPDRWLRDGDIIEVPEKPWAQSRSDHRWVQRGFSPRKQNAGAASVGWHGPFWRGMGGGRS
jgi:hypothetical protein